jgi:hypothetical protein
VVEKQQTEKLLKKVGMEEEIRMLDMAHDGRAVQP